MTRLICYQEKGQKSGWANIQMSSGDQCWVEVKQKSVVVKRANSAIFGVKLFEIRDIHKATELARTFDNQHPNVTPDEMRHPLLKPIVNAILHCGNLAEVTRVLNTA